MSGIMNMFVAAKTTVATAVDAFFNSVSLLLNTSSTNGAQNNTFLDSSTNNFTITRNGNTTQGTFTPFSQTGWSNYFNGTSDYLTIGTGVTFGSGAFTIECWFNANAFGTYYTIIGNGGTNSLVLSVDSATSVKIDQINVGSDTYTVSSISLNAWHHLAVVRDSSNNMTVFVDGVRATTGSTTVTKNYSVSTKAVGYVAGGDYWHGYISNLRCVVGTAVYSPTSSTLTVPTTPLTTITNTALLTCQSNRFIDNSTNAYSLTPSGTPSVQAFSPFLPTAAYDAAVVGGSGYFDGSGDYLSCGSQSAYAFGTGNFTLEAWVYVSDRNAQYNIAATRGSGATVNGWNINITTSGGIVVFTDNFVFNNVGTVPLNAWTHIVFTRSGTGTNQTVIYINGVSVATATNSQDFSNTTLGVGNANDGSQYPFLGYISGVRLVKGTAVYTAAFTPPTAPLTAISGTSLLLSGTNAGIYDSAAKNVLETVGNAQVSTTQAKWGTTSMYFDGTGDNLSFPSNNLYNFGSSDFTIEFWFYPPSVSYGAMLYSTNNGSKTDVFALYSYGSGQSPANSIVALVTASGGGAWSLFNNQNLGSTTAATWQHVALVRNGSTFKGYINGVAGFTVTSSSAIASFNGFSIASNGASGDYLTGYIDDLRITRYARYTADFTPPTAAFPLQ
jgi:hypothetical protein